MGPPGSLGGGQGLNFMRNTFGAGSNQGEHLSLPSVAGATFNKIGASHAIGSHLLGQENNSDNTKGQGETANINYYFNDFSLYINQCQ